MAEFSVQEALALAWRVRSLLCYKFERPTYLHKDIDRVERVLNVMNAYLIDFEGGIYENRHQIQEIATDIVELLDKLMHKLVSHDHGVDKLMHKQVLRLMKQVAFWVTSLNLSARIDRIDVKNTDFVRKLASQPYDSRRVSKSRLGGCSPQDSELANYNEVQGFEALAQKLFENLIDEEPQLSTICVVGPGGSGKSTLVNFVFKWKVVELFECKTWVRVTRRPLPLKELLQHMLTDFGYKNSEEIDNPGAKLRLFLQQRRYLVVLDDVWSTQDFDCIVKALPKGAPGSKMVITSRNSSVVSFLSSKYIHDLSSGLSPEAAKNLFTRKVLRNHLRNLQPEVEECADKILQWCGNQPFAISAVGSLLAEKPQTRAEWEDIYNNLGSKTGPGSILEIVSKILQPSFMDLPNHLKSCFLYLSIFPPNYAIQPERLIHLWVAEGLAERYASSSKMPKEYVAQSYLNELISRNLVLATEREINGQLQSCCVVLHHVRDYILSKEENFVTVLESDADRRTRPAFEKIRRLSVLKADCVSLRYSFNLNHLHTLVVFGSWSYSELEWVLENCKYLRVLDLQGVTNLKEFPENFSIKGLILLKYLSLRGSRNTTVPKSIRKYQCLETLVLEDTMVIKLPEKEMRVLKNLRHFSVSSNHTGGVMLSAGNIKALSSIHGLSLIKVKNNRAIIKALGELKNVRNLGLVDLETQDGKELCTALEKMKHLSTLDIRAERLEFLDLDHMRSPPHFLQGLHLEGRLEGLPKWILQLSSLEKIGLHGSELRANVNPLELLEALPYLLELDLVAYYKGEKLIFTAGTFKRLMILKMEQFTELNSISFDDGAMPRLRELTISRCPNLSSLPNGIRGLSSLYKLDLDYMPHKLIQLSAPSDGSAYSRLQFYNCF